MLISLITANAVLLSLRNERSDKHAGAEEIENYALTFLEGGENEKAGEGGWIVRIDSLGHQYWKKKFVAGGKIVY
ncbi:MAG: hypothetical protein PVF73_03565 [Bacteroidales bacterium]